jgi:hypothetical protein
MVVLLQRRRESFWGHTKGAFVGLNHLVDVGLCACGVEGSVGVTFAITTKMIRDRPNTFELVPVLLSESSGDFAPLGPSYKWQGRQRCQRTLLCTHRYYRSCASRHRDQPWKESNPCCKECWQISCASVDLSSSNLIEPCG